MAQLPIRERSGSVVAYALVDDDLYPELSRWRWSMGGRYVARGFRRDGRTGHELLHRRILRLGPADAREGDHINRDRLDNRRANLRVVTRAEGAQNKSPYRGGSSRFRGVHWDAERGKWRAQAQLFGRKVVLGQFTGELDAADAAAAFRREHMPAAVD